MGCELEDAFEGMLPIDVACDVCEIRVPAFVCNKCQGLLLHFRLDLVKRFLMGPDKRLSHPPAEKFLVLFVLCNLELLLFGEWPASATCEWT
jgi:hypothetical protein